MTKTGSPVRTCVGCRERGPRSARLRVVAAPPPGPTVLVVDWLARQPGRGAWVHPSPVCVAKAIKRQAFARALRRPGAVDAGQLERFVEL